MDSRFDSFFAFPRTHSSRLFPRLVTLSILLGSLLALPSAATTIVRVADAHLAQQAELAVEATVVDGGFVITDRGPVTEYRLAVERVHIGELVPKELRVRVPGGIDSETGEMVKVFGAPQFDPGEKVYLLLEEGAEGTMRPLHLMQGVFRLTEVGGEVLAHRLFVDTETMSMPGRKALPTEGPRQMERFGAWMRDAALGEMRSADYRVEEGSELAEKFELALAEKAPREKFTFIEIFNRPVRWPQFDNGNRVTWRSHNAGQLGVPGGGHSQFQTAINVWNNDGGSRIDLNYGGQTGNANGLGTSDLQNNIVFNDIANDIAGTYSCAAGGTVASTSVRAFSNQTHTFQGTLYTTLAEADIAMQNGIECFIGAQSFVTQVFGHELGHGIGLGHSCDLDGGPPGSCNTTAKREALMRAQIHSDGRSAVLNSDDRAAIGLMYNQPVTSPNAPSNLSASNVESGIRLSWSDNSNNESSFRVERRVGSGSFSEIGSTSSSSFTDTSVSSGVTYGYRVRARNSAGDSGYSNTATITASGEPAPGNLTAQVLSATQVQLTWIDNSSSEAAYEVESNGFGVWVPAADLPADSTSVTLTGLNPSTAYDFRVRSVGGSNGDSSYATTSATTPAGTPDPCVAGDNVMCLNNDRFKVEVFWQDSEGVRGVGSVVPIDPTDSGLFYFFDENNWELLIKVLDGCIFTDHFWVFAAATTDVEYTLVVTDTVTGTPAVYTNPLGNAAAAITDTGALPVCDAGSLRTGDTASESAAVKPVTAKSMTVKSMNEVMTAREALPELKALLDAESRASGVAPTKEGCMADEDTMCLTGGRFQLEIDWNNGNGGSGVGSVVSLPIGPSDSGLFWFFDENNWEMLVKVLDACSFNDRFWVLAAATTDVGYTLTITDTQQGVFQVYGNTAGDAAPALIDTEAFATCP